MRSSIVHPLLYILFCTSSSGYSNLLFVFDTNKLQYEIFSCTSSFIYPHYGKVAAKQTSNICRAFPLHIRVKGTMCPTVAIFSSSQPQEPSVQLTPMAAPMIDIVVNIPEQDAPMHLSFASSDTIKCVAKEISRRCDIGHFQLRKKSAHLKYTSTLEQAGIVSGVLLTVAKVKLADPARRAQLRLDQGKAKRSHVHTQLRARVPTTAAPEEATTAAPEEATTAAPEEATTAAPEEATTAPELIQTKECTFTYSIREGASCATSLAEELEEMAKEVGMTATRGIDIPMLQKPLRRSFLKELPHLFTSRFPTIAPFWVGEMVCLLPWGLRQPPFNESVKVVELCYQTEVDQVKVEVANGDINPYWPMEFCKLADPVPIM